MDLAGVLEAMTEHEDYRGQLVHSAVIPGRQAHYGELASELSPQVKQILSRLGIGRLYSHQAEAIDAALRGENTMVVTSTASGKTLCYLVPIAERLAERSSSRALLIYPTKALAQDQLRKLKEFGAGEAFEAATYDGDTPQAVRREVKKQAQVVLTNPDMLHVGILPYHHTWAGFFRNLDYVVIDEVHTYRGIFGSHTANVMRRLRRIAAHYGAKPQFVCCSATIGNPRELGEALTGVKLRLVADDGSPSGRRIMGWWNPPLSDAASGERLSANVEAANLLCYLARRDVRSITFTLARSTAELILRYARDRLREEGLADKVMAYRGGYLPEQRREIERRLFDGELLAVTSTTALELGVDIGGIDAVIMVGYPGSIASVWQQAGRAGRGGDDALAILIAVGGGIHQYLVQHPEYLLAGIAEHGVVNPQNEFILGSHLLCAAYEKELEKSDELLFGGGKQGSCAVAELLELLARERYLTRRGQKWYWVHPELYPAGAVSIRSISGAAFDIVDAESDALLGTVDGESALRTIHEGAIYMHAGETYRVERLDIEARSASVVAVEADYFTRPLVVSSVASAEPSETLEVGRLNARYGEVTIRSQVTGYRKISQTGHRELGSEELDLPTEEFETCGLWLGGMDALEVCAEGGFEVAGALHALEHMMIALLPLFALCDQRDVGGAAEVAHAETGEPTVFIYDAYPGGVGIARAAYLRLEELLQAAAETIRSCACESGCPSCVQSPFYGSNNEPLDKAGAGALAEHWAGALGDRIRKREGKS
jgi:DEAD/DEAH box helicase domain-containing protein